MSNFRYFTNLDCKNKFFLSGVSYLWSYHNKTDLWSYHNRTDLMINTDQYKFCTTTKYPRMYPLKFNIITIHVLNY